MAAPIMEPSSASHATAACQVGASVVDCVAPIVVDHATALDAVPGFTIFPEQIARSVAASAARVSETISAVPLPAAGWLLFVSMGGLGLFGKRRKNALPGLRKGADPDQNDGVEPLATALRDSARTDISSGSVKPFLLKGMARLSEALLDCSLTGRCPQAFSPGRSSPDRPHGGAGSLYAATAKRGPPNVFLNVPGAFPAPEEITEPTRFHPTRTRLQGIFASLAARLSHVRCKLIALIPVSDGFLPVPARRLVLVPVRSTLTNQNGSNPHFIRACAACEHAVPGAAFIRNLQELGEFQSC
jgi:hypothetical protein